MRAHRGLQTRESFIAQELEIDCHGYLIARPLSASNRCTPAGSTERCTLEPGDGRTAGSRRTVTAARSSWTVSASKVHHHLVAQRLHDVDVQLETRAGVVGADRTQALGTDPHHDVGVGNARPREHEVARRDFSVAHRPAEQVHRR